ncbi:hypothetical protein SBOR_1425 [Sclerotinia borealis F-4128]|uniref:Hydantoin racemase n=1 Tax=Sclerotinia borealis (strain F-4128) TaxID=1432307 RepID=W9CN22_SCLBF|nr:hypothetical protein SBOR_1425 [Sclerotinia borealis F-4128]
MTTIDSIPKRLTDKKLLVLNPNSSKSMTEGLHTLLSTINDPPQVQISFYTAHLPSPPSINNEEDALLSTEIVLSDLTLTLDQYDAILVACYSVHPLVTELKKRVKPNVHVAGIFEASVMMSLGLLSQGNLQRFGGSESEKEGFGIVSTGKYWEEALAEGVRKFLGVKKGERCDRFKGVETTGLTAGELHSVDPEIVRIKMKEAVKRLIGGRDCFVICLGCAGMAGMDDMVREALIEELGPEDAKKIYIVDGVKAGVVYLEGNLKAMPNGSG